MIHRNGFDYRKATTDPETGVTAKERAILLFMLKDSTIKGASHAFGISEQTVRTHRKHLYEKLGAHNEASLIVAALRRGVIRLEEAQWQ